MRLRIKNSPGKPGGWKLLYGWGRRLVKPLLLGHKVGPLQRGAQSQIQRTRYDYRDHRVDAGRNRADFGPDGGRFLGNAQHISLIEVSYNGIGHNIERHTGDTGQVNGNRQRNLPLPFRIDFKHPVGKIAGNQADAQLQHKSLWCHGNLNRIDNICNPHSDSTG